MNFLNNALSFFGLQLSRVNRAGKCADHREREFRSEYERNYKIVADNKRGFKTIREYRYQTGDHPFNQKDLECQFAAYHIHKLKPKNILDIGSFRHFILGLLAHYDLTSIDIRERTSLLQNESIFVCESKSLNFPDNSFETVLSLQALPHFGLGRYGDEFDLDADMKAFSEMIRALKPGGYLIFSAAITGAAPFIAYNARRNYSYEMIREFCKGLNCIEEKFIRRRELGYISLKEITADPFSFDYYIGCWSKPQGKHDQ